MHTVSLLQSMASEEPELGNVQMIYIPYIIFCLSPFPEFSIKQISRLLAFIFPFSPFFFGKLDNKRQMEIRQLEEKRMKTGEDS